MNEQWKGFFETWGDDEIVIESPSSGRQLSCCTTTEELYQYFKARLLHEFAEHMAANGVELPNQR